MRAAFGLLSIGVCILAEVNVRVRRSVTRLKCAADERAERAVVCVVCWRVVYPYRSCGVEVAGV